MAAWGSMYGRMIPWAKGALRLPTSQDVERLSRRTNNLYVTAVPALARVKKDSNVEKLVRQLHGDRVSELRGWTRAGQKE